MNVFRSESSVSSASARPSPCSSTRSSSTSRGESTESITTLSNRTLLWDIAFQLVGERPLTGYGLTASRGVFFEAIHLGGAHNAFVNVLVDGGIVAAGLWLGVIVTIGIAIRNAARRRDVDTALLAGLLVTLMVNGLTTEGVGSGSGVSALWLFILAGWVGVMQREWAAHRRSPRVVHRNVVQRTPVRPRSTHPTAPTGDRRRAAIAAAARPTAIGPGPRPEATTALPAGSPAPKALPASPDRPKALEPGTRPGATSDTAPAPGTQRRGKHFRPPVD
ncbi:MAG: O-antigen ligase family protein [Microthrixaceae bacterium]